MSETDRPIREFFSRVAGRDPELLRRIAQTPAFALDDARWRFTLPDLHAFLQRHSEPVASMDYRTFRKQIYRCPVNADLAPFGCRLVIADNRGKTDQSVYALEWSAGAAGH